MIVLLFLSDTFHSKYSMLNFIQIFEMAYKLNLLEIRHNYETATQTIFQVCHCWWLITCFYSNNCVS